VPISPGRWDTVVTFADQSTYKERALWDTEGDIVGIEARLFNADGSLRPLADGSTSLADTGV
jgi:hypothetical protein